MSDLNGVNETGVLLDTGGFSINQPDNLNSNLKPNNTRWSKVCDWAKAHKKELIAALLVIGLIVGIALMCFGIPLVAVATPAAPSALGSITCTLGGALTTISLTLFFHFYLIKKG